MSNELGWCNKHRFKITKNTFKKKENRCQECLYVRRYPVRYWLDYEIAKLKERLLHEKDKLKTERIKATIDTIKRKFELGVTIDPNYYKKKDSLYGLYIGKSKGKHSQAFGPG